MKLAILAPDRIYFEGEAEELVLPTNTGQIGILPNHTQLLTGLSVGVLQVRRTPDSSGNSTSTVSPQSWANMALMGGFALIQKNTITLLVNEAEWGVSINREEARKVYKETKEQYTQLEKTPKAKQKIEAKLLLQRAQARYQAVEDQEGAPHEVG